MHLGIPFTLLLITSTFAAPIPSIIFERSRGAVQAPPRLPTAQVGSGIGSVKLDFKVKRSSPEPTTLTDDQKAYQQAAELAKDKEYADAQAQAKAYADAQAKADADAAALKKAAFEKSYAEAVAKAQAAPTGQDLANAEAMEKMAAANAAVMKKLQLFGHARRTGN